MVFVNFTNEKYGKNIKLSTRRPHINWITITNLNIADPIMCMNSFVYWLILRSLPSTQSSLLLYTLPSKIDNPPWIYQSHYYHFIYRKILIKITLFNFQIRPLSWLLLKIHRRCHFLRHRRENIFLIYFLRVQASNIGYIQYLPCIFWCPENTT